MSKSVANLSTQEILSLRAQERIKGMDAISAIREYYMSDLPIELSVEQKKVRERIELAHSLLIDARSRSSIVTTLKRRYNVSESQAYADIRNAYKLFGEVNKSQKEGQRAIVSEWAVEIYRLGKSTGNADAMAKAAVLYEKTNKLSVEDPDMPDFANLEANTYAIVIDDPIRVLILNYIAKSGGSVDISDFMNKVRDSATTTEDISYETIEPTGLNPLSH